MSDRWYEGVSKGSIGRFGGFREDCVPYDSGYLTCSATATRLFLEMPDDRSEELGHYFPGHDFAVRTRTTWTGNRFEFSQRGRKHSIVTRSLLFPGFHHRLFGGRFEYYWRLRSFGPSHAAMPLAGGVTVRPATAGYDPATDGPLARPWILYFFAETGMPFDYPMLFVFDQPPEKIDVWTHEYLKIQFPSPKATVVQIHPFGAERVDKSRTAQWARAFPDEVAAKMDFWASAAAAYPVSCREDYRVDEARGVARLRLTYGYERFKSAWSVPAVELAPLPTVVAAARHNGYPVRVEGDLIEKICPSFWGHYEAVRGSRAEFEIPLSRFRDHTLAPVRIRNRPACDEVTRRLSDCLESGRYMTFGGDDHYDPETSIDSLHDLRIMAWAMHSVAPEKRPAIAALLARGLKNFDAKEFSDFTTTTTGLVWTRHKTIFDYLGVIDYDMEWYNGMNLAGLWAWAYYVQDPDADAFLRRRWPLIRKLNNYAIAYCDWAQFTTMTCCRGVATWLDGINYTYEGLLGLAALARRLGKKDDARQADYLAAKTELFVWNCWKNAGYVHEFFGGPERGCVGGYYEGRTCRAGETTEWSCGNYSYLVREVFVLLSTAGHREQIAREIAEFGRNFPKWRSDPYGHAKPSGYPGSDARRTVHHYFLDPRLMACALVLGEDLSTLMNVGAELTAPVLECYLVAQAPRILAPRDATFLGSVWDDKAKELTLELSGSGKSSFGIVLDDAREVAGPVDGKRKTELGTFYDVRLKGKTTFVLKFA